MRTGVAAVLAAAALAMAAPASGSQATGAAQADGPYQGTYSASANADGLRVTMTLPAAPLSNTVADVGGPTAQAVLDSNGASQAFASFPYPGANLAVAGGLVKGASNGQVPAPDYPFYVVAYNPAVPEQEVGSGPYAIKAETTATSSQGTATAGVRTPGIGTLGLAEATAATKSSPAAVVGSAASRVTGLAVGPLEIGELVSSATTTLGSDGKLDRQAETRLVAARVGLTPVVVDAGGVSAGGTAAPAADTKAVHEALAQAGITVKLFPREETETGVVAPVLRITQTQPQSGATVTYTVGGVAAFVRGTPAADTPSAVDEAIGGATPAASTPSSDTGSTPSAPPASPVNDTSASASTDTFPPASTAPAAFSAGELAAGSSAGSTSLPADAATLNVPDAALPSPSFPAGGTGATGAGGTLSSPPGDGTSTPIALANGFLVTRSHAAPTLIALTALIALALFAALAVHLLSKEARS
jgi:hypothetical protein